MIKVDNCSLDLPGFSLEEINLEIEKGEFFALIGPTGAGKSLLLEAIMGILSLRSGQIIIDQKEVTGLPPEKRGLGILYQDLALFPHMNVKKNILYGIKYQDISRQEVDRRFNDLIERLRLRHLLNRSPTTLSGGEKQRVALARLLILNPVAILLDEPLSALDPMFQDEIKDLFKSLNTEMGITFIMVSHNFTDVFYLADRGAIINKGQIIQVGPVQELFQKPNSCFVANFVGVKNLFQIRINGNKAIMDDLEINLDSSNKEDANFLALRPEDIVPVSDSCNNFDNSFIGTMTRLVCKGFYFEIGIRVGRAEFQAIWSRYLVEQYNLSIGDKIEIAFSANSVHTFRQ